MDTCLLDREEVVADRCATVEIAVVSDGPSRVRQFRSRNSKIWKGKGGRPRALTPSPQTLALFENAGRLLLLRRELADMLGVGRSTLQRFLAECPEAHQAFDRGFAQGFISPQRRLFRAAMRGNVNALISLSCRYLGHSHNGPNRPKVGG